MRKHLFILILFFPISLFAQDAKQLLKCLQQAYSEQLDFYSVLDELEQQLLGLGIIKGTNAIDYQLIAENFNEDQSIIVRPEDLRVDQYISSLPFKVCVGDFNVPTDIDKTVKYTLLLAIYIDIAAQKARINIAVDNSGEIRVNDKITPLDQLQDVLTQKSKAMMASGIPQHEIHAGLMVDSEVKIGLIVDIQLVLRDSNIRKITYYAPDVKE